MERQSGFTLIELVVVVGVIAIIGSLMLANFPRFNKELAVEREGGRLVLSLRKAQSYAMAVREFDPNFNNDPFCTNPPVRFPGYGIFATLSDTTHYLVYGDVNCSQYYDSAPLDETVETINMENGALIAGIKGYDFVGCTGGCDLNEISILYIRPGPTTVIKSGGAAYDHVEITLKSSDGSAQKKVVVRVTGQISIE